MFNQFFAFFFIFCVWICVSVCSYANEMKPHLVERDKKS